MRRLVASLVLATLLTVTLAGAAFGAHCINESKKDGAGELAIVLVNPFTGQETIIGANPAGQAPGGFADVYLDFDQSGTVSAGDVQIEEDIFLISNRSHKDNPAQGRPGVLPPILNGQDPGGEGHGISGG